MRSVKLTLAYDGTAYSGWQLQPARKTIQGVLENILKKITTEEIRVLASGRTDAGVHALGQVVGFRTSSLLPNDVLLRAINAQLPHDISVLECSNAPANFHAIGNAIRKKYRYVIHDGPIRPVFERTYCWKIQQRLDAQAMDQAAQNLLGKHDFSSFETSGAPRESSIRNVTEICVKRGNADRSDFVTLEIAADGFLYNMVRAIVGTLVEVGRHAQSEAWISEVLEAKNRKMAGQTAPPQGLFLVNVDYQTCESHTSSLE